MRLLIVNLHLDIGGVETLLVRLIPQLAKRGVSVTLLLLQKRVNQEFLDALTPFCQVKFIGDAFPFTKSRLRAFFGEEPDVAYFTISQAFVFGSWLLSRAGYQTKTVLGAYQTEIFCPEATWWQYHRAVIRRAIQRKIPPSSIVFGNTAGRDYHADKLTVNLDESPIIRLFVDVEKYRFIERAHLPRRKIVSIGRISPYKTYNFTVLPVIRKLVDAGHPLEWHIYGDGENLESLEKAVADMGLESNVFLHGVLQYSKFQQVLDEAFLFIGSGTSLIEAAACGVPALTTIEYAQGPDSYGYICDIEGYNLIEPGLNKKVYSIEEKVLQAIEADRNAYSLLQHRCLDKAMSYSGSSVVDEYISVFSESTRNGKSASISDMAILGYCGSAAANVIGKKLGLSK